MFIENDKGIVVGEKEVVEDNVQIMNGVKMGGKGKQRGDRNKKISKGVMIGEGEKIIGKIKVGK